MVGGSTSIIMHALNFTGRRTKDDDRSSCSDSSRFTVHSIKLIIEKLKSNQNRESTAKNYISIWRHLNKFLGKLDYIPDSWEERVSLFCAHLIDCHKIKSTTLQSYISAIKHTLKVDGYDWNDGAIWLGALVKSCKLVNDQLYTRLPIQFSLFEQIMFELERMFDKQPYLEVLYKAIFSLSYYGLLRVGEVSNGSPHYIRASDVYVADNKDKIMVLLYSSKMHSVANQPQEVKISGNESSGRKQKFFCPFKAMRTYIAIRDEEILTDEEPFFIYSDHSLIPAENLRKVLKQALTNLNINVDLYNFQSFRIGRTTDLLKFGFDIETIKRMGRWKSNVVYKYLRPLY